MSRTKRYLQKLNPLELVKTKKVLKVNPIDEPTRDVFKSSVIEVFQYSELTQKNHKPVSLETLPNLIIKEQNIWVNVDVVHKETVEKICDLFKVHPLLQEDILSVNQRPKIDEIDNQIYCVLQMMYYNDLDNSIENEQISFVLGKKFLLSFQDDETRDHFNLTRQKLAINSSKIRTNQTDYLLYSLLDAIVDQYYYVMEKLGTSIENLEENISQGITDDYTMNQINNLRKEMIVYRRNIVPLRDLLTSILSNDNGLIEEKNKRYFKDVYDHVIQAVDLSENYRDIVNSIRDLYINQINLKSNAIMKFLTIVTTLLAPATVIGGIFGMNFDKIPYLHNTFGFWLAVGLMLIIPMFMLAYFKKKEWF
jgi:magnesium transporter